MTKPRIAIPISGALIAWIAGDLIIPISGVSFWTFEFWISSIVSKLDPIGTMGSPKDNFVFLSTGFMVDRASDLETYIY